MKIIECPRDALQGLKRVVPTKEKVAYHQALLEVNFDTLDIGSFVSPKAVPQLADTADVLNKLNLSKTKTKLLVIVANERGAKDACTFDQVTYLGYPLSISETFQQRNTNQSILASIDLVKEMQDRCQKHNKQLVVYISMGFGNPYGDPYSAVIVRNYINLLADIGIKIISIADTVGLATPEEVSQLYRHIAPQFPLIEFGLHLHANPSQVKAKVKAAIEAGCKRIDTAMKGFGGCPFAKDDLVGNLDTGKVIECLDEHNMEHKLNMHAFKLAEQEANKVFLV